MVDELSKKNELNQLFICTVSQVGMRHFHYQRNPYHCPIVNVDKLWALVGEEVSGLRLGREGALQLDKEQPDAS